MPRGSCFWLGDGKTVTCLPIPCQPCSYICIVIWQKQTKHFKFQISPAHWLAASETKIYIEIKNKIAYWTWLMHTAEWRQWNQHECEMTLFNGGPGTNVRGAAVSRHRCYTRRMSTAATKSPLFPCSYVGPERKWVPDGAAVKRQPSINLSEGGRTLTCISTPAWLHHPVE